LIELVVVVVVVVGVEGVMVNGEGERWRMVRIVRCRERRIHGFREREREGDEFFFFFNQIFIYNITTPNQHTCEENNRQRPRSTDKSKRPINTLYRVFQIGDNRKNG